VTPWRSITRARCSAARCPSAATTCTRRRQSQWKRCCGSCRRPARCCRAICGNLACGKHGHIVDVLRRHGHRVIGSDLVDYGRPDFFARRDFLLEQKAPDGCEAIVTNPPFKLAEQFVAHALELCPRVVMLLRLAFMESERRTPILEGVGLKHIFVFRKRLPMMHRAGWEGRKANSGMAFGWFCWDRRHRGPTLISRISWERDDG
jgi:hypothetical protein